MKFIVIVNYLVLKCLFYILVVIIYVETAIIYFTGIKLELVGCGTDDDVEHCSKDHHGVQVDHDDNIIGLIYGVEDVRPQAKNMKSLVIVAGCQVFGVTKVDYLHIS